MSESEMVFLQLVRLGIGTTKNTLLPYKVNWSEVEAIAERQGLLAVVVDGIEKLPENQRPPQEDLLQLIGSILQDYEYRFETYKSSLAELASFYNSHGYRMMILKGYACSLDWPKPEHRPYGDIDIWLFDRQKEADALIAKEKGIKVDSSHHHHTIFYWDSFMVENHYDFVNVHHHKSNVELEKTLKALSNEDSKIEEINNERIYIPSPDFHALFLLRHAMNHFAASELSLRQLLDWAFFVKEHGNVIKWDWLNKTLGHYKMSEMFNIFNAICVEEFGFDAGFFHSVQYNPALKERVLEDIMTPAFGTAEPTQFLRRLVYKYRRWQGNAWKQRLCYPDSRWSAFWSGVWSHILKPSSI